MSINEMFSDNRLILNKVNYSSIPIDPDMDINNIEIKDRFSSEISIDENKLFVTFSRTINFVPPQIMSIEVEYKTIWYIDNEHIDDVKNKNDSWTNEEINILCYTAISETALLVSLLTKANCMPPLWTPNEFVHDENNVTDKNNDK